MKALKLKPDLPTEDYEAQCLIQWARVTRYKQWALSDLLLMIPNGAYLGGDPRQRAITMGRMKRMGFRSGIFDYLLPVPRGAFPGLWLELKRRQLGVVSNEQGFFKLDMEVLGWKTAIARGWEEARVVITEYLAL